MYYSPLRYPGGKNKLSAFIAKICIDNKVNGHYVEPYSGGASVALFLLLEGFVDRITINDRDRSIYAFWHSVLNKTNKLCEMIENAELTIEEWKKQREIQNHKKSVDLLTLGFSTFYLNRTNRSGIINAGLIGGLDQSGDYLMDCRFNKSDLIDRIKKIATKKKSIRLYKKDAIKLIDKIQNESQNNNVVFYFDPPYYLKASTLYMNHYDDKSHKKVSDKIRSIKNIKWIVSYDNVPEIQKLYANCQKKEFSFKHTAYEIREGQEIMFFSQNIEQPQIEDWNPLRFKLIKEKKSGNNIVYRQ
jgi:DNA adenine methylase